MKKLSTKKQRKWRKKVFSGKNDCMVYVVLDENSNARYVGQTRCHPDNKKFWMVKSAKQNPRTPFHKWLLAQIAAGKPWSIDIIDAQATWDVSEIIWIDRLRQAGCELLNVLRGGKDSYDDLTRHKGHKFWRNQPKPWVSATTIH